MTMLDDLRSLYRSAGQRTVTASDLIRTALDVAEKHPEEWNERLMAGRRRPERVT